MEAAFDIDTVSGMQVDINDDMLDNLLKSAVSGTGVPFTFIDASAEVEFSRSLAVQNQGFVRKVINYQKIFGDAFTEIVRRMYDFEYGITPVNDIKDESANEVREEDEIDIDKIEIRFPAPVALNIQSVNDLIDSTNTTLDYIVSMQIGEDNEKMSEDGKRRYKRNLAKNIYMRNLDWDLLDKILLDTETEITKDKIEDAKTGDDASEGEDSY